MTSRDQSQPPLVLVEWIDASQPVEGWKFIEDAPDLEIVECVSVGWLVKENDKVLMLVPNIGGYESGGGAQGLAYMRIPKVAITRMVQLQEVSATSVLSGASLSSHPEPIHSPLNA